MDASNPAEIIETLPSEFLQLLLDSAPVQIAYLDMEQRFRYANKAYLDWFGLTHNHILGKPIVDMIGRASFAPLAPHVPSALSGLTVAFQSQIRYENGTSLALYTTLVPHRDSVTGQVQGVLLYVSDTTELRHTQQRLIAAYNRVMLIDQVGRAARSASDPQSILQTAVEALGQTLQADRCYYVTYDKDLDQGTITPEWYHQDLSGIASRFKMSDYNINRNMGYQSGQTHVVDDTYDLADHQMADRYGLRSLLRVPLQQGTVMTALCVAMASPRHWTSDEIGLVETVATQTRAAVESARASHRERSFLRDVLSSVTEGKLRLLDSRDQLPSAKSPVCPSVTLTPNSGLRELRQRISEAAEFATHTDDRQADLITAAGEASMNSVVHAGGGSARVCGDETGTIQIWIEDTGTGIAFDDIPRATLEKGWSSGSSLGHGFWLMLKTVDRIWLLTGTTGTTVVLEQDRIAPGPAWLTE